jgi:hypothetical protein
MIIGGTSGIALACNTSPAHGELVISGLLPALTVFRSDVGARVREVVVDSVECASIDTQQ